MQIVGVFDIGVQAAAAPTTATAAVTPLSLNTDGSVKASVAKGAATNASATAVGQNGVATSAIKFIGTEDIGGGLKAGFLAEINPNLVRSSTSNQANAFASEYTGTPFSGEQFISLAGGFGEVKLGVPNAGFFLAENESNPFVTGLGSGYAAAGFARLGTTAPGIVSGVGSGTSRIIRHERSFQYTTPSFNGLSGMVTLANGNDNSATSNQDGYQDISVMYKNGPLSVAYSNAVNKFGTNPVLTLGGAYANVGVNGAGNLAVLPTPNSVGSAYVNGDFTYNVLAGNYTFGTTTVYAGYTTTKSNGFATQIEDATSSNIAFKHVMGSIDLLGNYTTRSSNIAKQNNAKQLGLGVNYNLSKRTSVYYRYEFNDYNTDSKDDTAATALGGSITTVNMVGIRHAF